MNRTILIIAGEASGDNVGGLLCGELKRLRPDIELFGLGGERMQRSGVRLLYHINRLAFLGFLEIVKHIPFIRTVEKDLLREAEVNKPDLAILIDYPGFNLRIAQKLKARGIPIVYYVSPQVWAWGKKRIPKIKALVDKMIVVFEFERDLYSREGMEVEWYGHPLLDIVSPQLDKSDFLKKAGLEEDRRYIGLFPGSRLQEIGRILPVMRLAMERLRGSGMALDAIVGAVDGVDESVYRSIVGEDFKVLRNMTYDIMANAELNLVASGTATLECAILGKPLLVLYKTSVLTYLIAKNLVKIPNIGLVNVVAGRRIVPEFVQPDCNPDKVSAEISRYFSDSTYRREMAENLKEVRAILGDTGASRKVADSILRMLPDTDN